MFNKLQTVSCEFRVLHYGVRLFNFELFVEVKKKPLTGIVKA